MGVGDTGAAAGQGAVDDTGAPAGQWARSSGARTVQRTPRKSIESALRRGLKTS